MPRAPWWSKEGWAVSYERGAPVSIALLYGVNRHRELKHAFIRIAPPSPPCPYQHIEGENTKEESDPSREELHLVVVLIHEKRKRKTKKMDQARGFVLWLSSTSSEVVQRERKK